jgi:hypothetical protein
VTAALAAVLLIVELIVLALVTLFPVLTLT